MVGLMVKVAAATPVLQMVVSTAEAPPAPSSKHCPAALMSIAGCESAARRNSWKNLPVFAAMPFRRRVLSLVAWSVSTSLPASVTTWAAERE